MSGKEDKVEVFVKYQEMEVRFLGTTPEVTRSFLDFMSKILPSYALIHSLTITIDLETLLKDLEGILAITPEGMIITIPREKTGEREIILLNLVKMNVSYQLGKTENESVSIADLLKATGGKPSSTAARLSELVDLSWVDRVGRGEYRITTFGLKSFIETVLPKLKLSL